MVTSIHTHKPKVQHAHFFLSQPNEQANLDVQWAELC